MEVFVKNIIFIPFQRHFEASVLALASMLGAGSHGTAATGTFEKRPVPHGLTYEQPIEEFRKLPLRFESNRGQLDSRVKFLCRVAGYTLFLTSTEAVMSLPESLLGIRVLGAKPNPSIEGIDVLPGTTNYFLGNDPKRWHTDVPSYSRVTYRGVYPGVDLVYHGNGRRV